ncbi:hypothetical protein JCM6882_005068 [Rhodosporidiobolus microsporus]
MAQQARPPSAAGPSSFAWEGDSTLHSYCYDYMRKRGWNESASRFAKDAGIEEATWTGPPIEAPQGLLYEWWSVFWDVFIARSQKAGQRNPNADLYVEAMRAKRDPLVVQFAGQNPPPPMNLPRSLAHPPRPPPAQAGGPPRAQYSQMHVLEQQELQNQMQRGRVQQVQVQRAGPGGQPPPPGAYGPPGSQAPLAMHAGPSQGPLPPQHGGNVPQPHMPPYPPQNPHQPPSVHSSPHMVAASPYTNGRIPPPQQGQQQMGMPPQQQQQQQQQQQGPMSAAMTSAMNAVGLGGRDPDSLSQEEHAAVAAQMRRVGALPPTPQQGQMRNQPMRVVQQRMPPEQQMRQQGPYVGMPPQGQQMMQDPNRPGMQQLPPQQRMVQGQYGPPPGQAGSPASPAYSGASPYTTPHVAHMQIPPPNQSSPQQFIAPLPPPSRGPGNQKNRLPSAGGLPPQPSPAQMGGLPNPNAAAKRAVGPGGNLEDPSPRSRKRVRGGTRDEEMFGPGGMPETPNFEPGGPGSPGGMMVGMPPGVQGFGPDGIPYRPSPSPQLMQPPDGKRPLPPGMGPPPQHQQMYVTGPSPAPHQQQQYMGGGGGDPGMNGHPGMNGTLSRPTSAASNHHFLGAPPGPDQRLSPAPPQQGGMPPPPPSQHPSPSQLSGLSQPPPGGNGDPNSLGVGGSRPFAGAGNPPSASTTPLPPPPQNLAPPPPDPNANGIPVGPPTGGDAADDVFAGMDNIDFDSFLNGDMFAEDGTS